MIVELRLDFLSFACNLIICHNEDDLDEPEVVEP